MSHFLVCVDTHHHQARFVLFDRCRTLSLCVCTNDSQCLSSFTNWTSRSSAASCKAEYSVSVISPVVLPEKRCLKMESAVMDAETLELEQIMSRYVLVFECSLARSPCPPEACSQNLTPRPPCLSVRILSEFVECRILLGIHVPLSGSVVAVDGRRLGQPGEHVWCQVLTSSRQ